MDHRMPKRSLCALLQLLWVSAAVSESCPDPRAAFRKISGVDCVSPSFSRLVPGLCSPLDCSFQCLSIPKCQAFTLTSDICQCKLFLFDACSHRVQSVPNCANQVTVYVRSLPGVPRGQLCPAGYSYTRYGTSYKVVTSESVSWDTAKQRCSQEAGLSKFADALDMEESLYLASLKQQISGFSHSYFVGGQQMPGAADRFTNWFWVACNLTIANVWSPDEPNSGLPVEGCAEINEALLQGIADNGCAGIKRFICECQSVF